MSGLREYFIALENNGSEALQIVQETASKLESRETSLIYVVESLGESINDEDADIRTKTVSYLSQILTMLPSTFLTRQQVQVLCQFFCDRMEDGGAIPGLNFLATTKRFTTDMVIQTFRAMLEHFRDIQLRTQGQRFDILTLLSTLMGNYRNALNGLGTESLLGVMDLGAGEKDPRNLMIVFSILQVVLIEWDITAHVEMLFESIFCYFPVTFRPLPKNPYGITAQDLKIRLKECIAASHYFAPYAFPQLLDKLDSTSVNVKKDVLQAIAACASAYSATTMTKYSGMIWDLVKYEIFNAQEEELAVEARVALKAIAKCLADEPGLDSKQAYLVEYIRPILNECNERLQEPENKQAAPATEIVKIIAESSLIALSVALEIVFPPLLRLYSEAASVEKRRSILQHLFDILKSANSVFRSNCESHIGSGNFLVIFKDQLVAIFTQALMDTSNEEPSFRVVAMKCLSLCCLSPNLLTAGDINIVIQYFNEIAVTEAEVRQSDLKKAALQSLRDMSKERPEAIMEMTFPAFMARLPDTTPESKLYQHVLDGLVYISCEPPLSDTLVRRLFSKLEFVLQFHDSMEYAEAILISLHRVLSQRHLSANPSINSYYEKAINLICRAVDAVYNDKEELILAQTPILFALGRLVCLIVRHVDMGRQVLVGQNIYSLFNKETPFDIFFLDHPQPELRRRKIILSTYLLAAIKSDVPLPYTQNQLLALLQDLIKLTLTGNNNIIQCSLLQHIAILVNKFTTVSTLEQMKNVFWGIEDGFFHNVKVSRATLRVEFWLCKALVMRLFKVEETLSHVLNLLSDSELGFEAAKGFRILLARDEIVSRENGATIRLLFHQKVFNICLTIIRKSINHAIPAIKTNYLLALSGLLRHIDADILKQNAETVVPPLLHSLDLNQQEVKAAAIEALFVLVCDNPSNIEEYTSSLISRLLRAAVNPEINSATVRHSALRCLRCFPGRINASILLTYRKAVTRGMLDVLDDPIRSVRKEGVTCNAAWLNLDEPVEPE